MREFLQILFEEDGYRVSLASNVAEATRPPDTGWPELVFTDLKLPDGTGMDVLKWYRERAPDVQVIMMTAYATTQNAVDAMRLGAYDYQLKPFKVDEVRVVTQKALEKSDLIRENRHLRDQLQGNFGVRRILGKSPVTQRLKEIIRKVAGTSATILIAGESGTGKELVARAIHEAGSRATGPFVPINCGAIPETLMEAELFGHAAGAFTGAVRSRAGMFELASGGTIFLDEIGELPSGMQVKLLRVLQERTVRRVGDDSEKSVDVRVLAATNRNLEDEVREGRFREDLYYRLNVVSVEVPPLRERTEDVELLARAFMARYAESFGRPDLSLTPKALRLLQQWDFPGNIRELENCMERAVALCSGSEIAPNDLPTAMGDSVATNTTAFSFPDDGVDLDSRMRDLEGAYIQEAMRRSRGVKTKAAELLGMSFRSFRYRVKKLGLGEEDE
jgi:two-component system response regulator PilR (NtrC family)